MAVRVAPITSADVPEVADFLHCNLNRRLSADTWARSMRPPWPGRAPNHGFMLRDEATGDEATGGAVVGAYLAFYADRTIDGERMALCNLGGWSVLPDYRFHSVRLLKALLAQDGYHFTDLSPSGTAVSINERFAFRFLDTTLALVPNLPWPSLPGRCRVSADPAVIERILTGPDLRRYRDHADAAAARHVVVHHDDQWCYVVFRKDRPKNLPFFASIVYVSHPAVLRRGFRQLTRHLLLRHGLPATLVELRVTGHRPSPSILLGSPRRKMFRSARLRPEQIDYLYSELVCVPF